MDRGFSKFNENQIFRRTIYTCLKFNQGFYKKLNKFKSDIHSSITPLIQELLERTTFF